MSQEWKVTKSTLNSLSAKIDKSILSIEIFVYTAHKKVTNHSVFRCSSNIDREWPKFVRILKTIQFRTFWHLIWSDWLKNLRHSDYCYANGPKIKIAVSPNDMPLSLQRMDIIGALCKLFIYWDFYITIVTAFSYFGQPDQMRCPNVQN